MTVVGVVATTLTTRVRSARAGRAHRTRGVGGDLEDHVSTGGGADRFMQLALRDDKQHGGRVTSVEDVFATLEALDSSPAGQRLHYRW